MKPVLLLPSFFSFEEQDKNKKYAIVAWILIALFCVIQSLITHRYNNYHIFENTTRNLLNQRSLYGLYPDFHFDTNHYGPVFSVFFAPFAAFPNALGFLLWNLFNMIVLFKAIDLIPIKNKNAIYFMAIPCFASASLSQQFNPACAAFIILSFTQLNKNKGFWSAMFIVLGTFIKLYGIVGLAFFFFVKDKKSFVLYLVFWSALLFVLPMLFSSPAFIMQSYSEWLNSLVEKNANNIAEVTTDVSIMGFVRSIYAGHTIPNSAFLLFGVTVFGLPFLNFKAYKSETFQLYILASVLLFPVLFSTGSEDCTYIIAVGGVGIWYLFAESALLKKIVFAVVFIISIDIPALFFPKMIDVYPVILTIMSFPFFIIWITIICKAGTFKNEQTEVLEEKSTIASTNYAT